jgi:hypothetical protein
MFIATVLTRVHTIAGHGIEAEAFVIMNSGQHMSSAVK